MISRSFAVMTVVIPDTGDHVSGKVPFFAEQRTDLRVIGGENFLFRFIEGQPFLFYHLQRLLELLGHIAGENDLAEIVQEPGEKEVEFLPLLNL